jgi:hypothetical protein
LPFEQRLRVEHSAPTIVLGRVIKVSEIGPPQRSNGDPQIKTQLTQIMIDVEAVIKGKVESSPIEFSYFVFSPASDVDLGVPRYLPAIGQRRLYFLESSNGTYRSVGDVTDFTLRVSSGTHNKDFCSGKSSGCCIAEILLLPQRDADIDVFVLDLIRSAYASRVLCSPRSAQKLLQQLTENPDQRISDGARKVLAAAQ